MNCIRSLPRFGRTIYRIQKVHLSEAVAPPPLDENNAAPIPENVLQIADQICHLTLHETGQLTKVLKERLGVGDVMMAAPGPAAATPAAADEAADAEPAAEEQNYFNIKLSSINAASKVKLIKAVKDIIPGINLVAAKKLVDSIPCTLKENVARVEAHEIRDKLVDMGAEIELE